MEWNEAKVTQEVFEGISVVKTFVESNQRWGKRDYIVNERALWVSREFLKDTG